MARRRVWLGFSLALFVLAAWLMSRGDAPRPERRPVEFPRYLRAKEQLRMAERRTVEVRPPPAPAGELAPAREPARMDPVLAALPGGESVMVVEANAIRHSPVGELLLRCALGESERRELERMRDEWGFDPLEDVDRVAVSEDVFLVTGHFGAARWEALAEGSTFEPYGAHGRFLRSPGDDGDAVAVWRDEMLLLGDSRDELRQAIDRLEGRAEANPAIDETQTYGEAYGVLSPEQLVGMMGDPSDPIVSRIREAAERIELHVDTAGDVALFADVTGPDAEQVVDLGKSLGAALSVARIKARAEDDDRLAELLEYARVTPAGDRFGLELALPLELIERQLGGCR